MQKRLPKIPSLKQKEIEMFNWSGMNNTIHPTLLPLNTPSNLQNSYFQDGVLDKRNGYSQFGAQMSGGQTITEAFTSTTYKDADNTTGDWNTTLERAQLPVTSNTEIEIHDGGGYIYIYGGIVYGNVNLQFAQKFTPSSSYYLTSVSIPCAIGSYPEMDPEPSWPPMGEITGKTVYCKIYSNSAGSPDAVLATASIATDGNNTNSSKTFTFSSPLLLQSGTTYWLSLSSDMTDPGYGILAGVALDLKFGTAGNAKYYWDAHGWYQLETTSGDGQTTLPAEFGFTLNTYAYNTSNNVIQSSAYDTGLESTTYNSSEIKTLNGGTISVVYSDSANGSSWGSWTSDITTLTRRYIRFKITLTGTTTTTPYVDTIFIYYGGVSIISSHSWTKSGTTEKYLLVVGGTNLYMYYQSSASYVPIKTNLTTGLRTTAAPFSNYLIITNGTDSVMRFNGKVSTGNVNVTNGNATISAGTSATMKWKTASNSDELSAGGKIKLPDGNWYTIQSITNDTTLVLTSNYAGTTLTNQSYEAYAVNTLAGLSTAGIGGGELKGKYVATYKSQVIISGIPNYESWIQVSAYLSGTTWSYTTDSSGNPTFTNGSGAINVSTDDGQIVTAIVPFGNSVQIHKSDIYGTKRSVHSLTRSGETWTNYPVTNQFASVSQYATIVSPNAVFFVDRNGIVSTNGVTFSKIDGDISSLTSTINQQYVQYSVAAYNVQEGNEFLYFGVPIGTSTLNDYLLMFDLEKRGWGVMTGLDMGCFAIYSDSYTPELYFGDQLSTSRVFKWNSGTNDNGSQIEWIVETAEIPIGLYFQKNRFKYLYAFFEPTGAYDVTAYYSVDGGAYVELADTVETSGSDDVFKRWTLPGLTGSTVKFKFYNNEVDQPITLVRAGVLAVEKGMRRI